jgi:uncharacterized cupin superfamily protein
MAADWCSPIQRVRSRRGRYGLARGRRPSRTATQRTLQHIEVFNVSSEQEWDAENDRDGFRHLRTAVGERLGGRLLGGSLYELPPGERTWPYHYEQGCEEWLIVVSGRPILRAADGERQLEPGDVAVFPEGPSGAHQVINRSEERCRVFVLSSKAPLAIVHYPDSGKVGFWSQAEGRQRLIREGPELNYWEGET